MKKLIKIYGLNFAIYIMALLFLSILGTGYNFIKHPTPENGLVVVTLITLTALIVYRD